MEEIRVKRGLAYSAYAMLDMNMSFLEFLDIYKLKMKALKKLKNRKRAFEDFIKMA